MRRPNILYSSILYLTNRSIKTSLFKGFSTNYGTPDAKLIGGINYQIHVFTKFHVPA